MFIHDAAWEYDRIRRLEYLEQLWLAGDISCPRCGGPLDGIPTTDSVPQLGRSVMQLHCNACNRWVA